VHVRTESVAVGLVVTAVVPCIALKSSWLTGASIGVRNETVLAELHSTRMIVGNNLTIVLELMAVGLALALASGRGRRVPAWIVLSVGAGATGLLAPILLGLPVGSVLQLAVRGDVRTGGMDHLSPWVFALVYGGFGLMATGIVVLASRYAADRWSHVLRRAPDRPPVSVIVTGGLGLLPFGAAMLCGACPVQDRPGLRPWTPWCSGRRSSSRACWPWEGFWHHYCQGSPDEDPASHGSPPGSAAPRPRCKPPPTRSSPTVGTPPARCSSRGS
jgi:hypothetical protein